MNFDSWALTLAVFLPAVGVVVMLAIPKQQELALKVTALAAALGSLGIGIYLLCAFDYNRSGELQFVVDKPWIDVIHSRYILGIDGISLPLLILSMVIVVLCLVYSWNHIPEPGNLKAFFILILVLEIGMNGTFVAQDLILFFVFFEVVLLPMYFMIGVWGGEQRQYAAIKFFLFTLFGSALMLLSFLALFFKTGGQSFSMEYIAAHTSGDHAQHPARDLRRPVHRLRDQGADVPVPHVAARRAHPGADRRLGDPGGDPPEARHVRVHPHRDPDPPRRRDLVGAVDRAPRGDRHHLRLALLPRADRHETADRVLVGRPHGLRHARHRDAHELRAQRRSVRHGRPRPHHRHALLPRRLGEGALPHPRDPPDGRAAATHPALRLDPRLLRDGLARAARPRRVLGRVPIDPRVVQPRRGIVRRRLPHLHGHRRDRHGARCRVLCSGCTSAPRSATSARRSRTSLHTTSRSPSGSRGRRSSSGSSRSASSPT